ncbi:hypothetical protein [uncultured Amphritea sp.]|uniref:hypothetical protein n=1 Tax=uncultured Amphritea sp. TaxID=981605 RepID=UPI00261BD976|nr:hypothetical protein [uncultured Amphritea sp.]
MKALTAAKQATNINWATAGSVVAGMALFGVVMWGIRKLPNNAVTNPVKNVANEIK